MIRSWQTRVYDPNVDPVLGRCRLETLRKRKSHKWQTYPADVLPAFVAEMDFDLAEPIVEAVRAALAIGDCGYGHKGELGEAFAAFAEKRLRWSPDPSRMFAIPDVMTGIAEVIQAVTPPGSGIVINPPVYQPFFYRVRLAGRRVVEAPLRRLGDGRYDLDPEAIDRALAADGASAYLLCSPHNPTGRVWSRQQLMTAADICQRHGKALLVDEIHAPLVLPGAEHVPFLSLDHEMLMAEAVRRMAAAVPA
jgi:cysteine-S-conjugate beta-lyase